MYIWSELCRSLLYCLCLSLSLHCLVFSFHLNWSKQLPTQGSCSAFPCCSVGFPFWLCKGALRAKVDLIHFPTWKAHIFCLKSMFGESHLLAKEGLWVDQLPQVHLLWATPGTISRWTSERWSGKITNATPWPLRLTPAVTPGAPIPDETGLLSCHWNHLSGQSF